VQRLEYEVLALVGDRSNTKVGRIEIILTGNSDQREQGVAASIDQSGAHALWARLLPGPIATTELASFCQNEDKIVFLSLYNLR
jgi:hypothetical protein